MKKIIAPPIISTAEVEDEYETIIKKESKKYTSYHQLPPILKDQYWLLELSDQNIRIND